MYQKIHLFKVYYSFGVLYAVKTKTPEKIATIAQIKPSKDKLFAYADLSANKNVR